MTASARTPPAGVDVFVIPHADLAVTTAVTRLLDDSDVHGAWIADSPPTHWRDVYATLALCATQTRRLTLGPGVTNPITRHPSVTAAAIATIEHLCPGRAVLGIGIGDAAIKGAGLKPASLAVLAGYVATVRRMLAERGVSVPVYLSAGGPRMLDLAGRIADGVLISVGAHPALLDAALSRVREGATAAGRDPEHIDVGFVVSLAIAEDPAEARRAARPLAAKKAKDFARSTHPVPGDLRSLLPSAHRLLERYDYRFHFNPDAPHNELVTDELLDAFTVAGTAAECAERVERIGAFLEERGAGRIVFQPGGGRREESIERLIREVLPKVERRR